MTSGRISVSFQPSYGKNMGHLSRKLSDIEAIIHAAAGSNFMIDPHNAAAFRFLLPAGINAQEAERIVHRLGTLADDDGQALLDVEQGPLSEFRGIGSDSLS